MEVRTLVICLKAVGLLAAPPGGIFWHSLCEDSG